jgi:hypothetical protein
MELIVSLASGARAALLAAAAVLVVGCGSATAPHSSGTADGATATDPAPTGTASAEATTSASGRTAGLAACRADSLRVTVDPRQAGGTAGSAYYPLDFTDISRSACTMYGYPGISFVTSHGVRARQIGAAAGRNPAFGKVTVRLAAGGVAHAWLQVAEAGNYPPSVCRPVRAHWLRVFAPGQTVASFLNYTADACASAKVPLLTVMPVRAGRGVQGRTP